MSYMHDGVIAEDIVSECMVKLWNALKTDEIENEEAFLFTCLKNMSLDELRKQMIERRTKVEYSAYQQRDLELRINSLMQSQYNSVNKQDIYKIVKASLATLPVRTQQVFVLSRNNLLSNKEIATKLNISVKGVEYHMSIVLNKLRVDLKDYFTYL